MHLFIYSVVSSWPLLVCLFYFKNQSSGRVQLNYPLVQNFIAQHRWVINRYQSSTGLVPMHEVELESLSYECFLMGMIFIICGLVSALFRSPKATTITVVLSTGVAVSMVIMILCCIFNERDRLSVIWKTRVNAFGLWSILICFIMGVMEIILGVSSITGLSSYF